MWPESDAVAGGPHQSYGYALLQARQLAAVKPAYVWRDHSQRGDGVALEDVSS